MKHKNGFGDDFMEQTVVQSVERTFKIIELLSENAKGLSLLEISKQTSLHKSTAHRLLFCLINMGYVVQDELTGIYRLSLKLVELSSRLIEENDLIAIAKPHLDRLNEIIGEAIHLVVPSSTDILYIYKVDNVNRSAVRMASRIGLKIPMYCTACGKAMLANMSIEKSQEIWNKSKIMPLTPKTILDFESLKNQFEQIRKDGYSIDDEENESGVICIGFPILDHNKKPVAAFSISAPAPRMTGEISKNLLPAASDTLEKITISLGYKY